MYYCSRSHGRCEDCEEERDCYDLPSGSYAHKDSLIGKEELREGRMTISSLKEKHKEFNPSQR